MPNAEPSARETCAAQWALRVQSGDMSAEDEARLDDWTGEDSRNLGAFTRAMAASAYFDRAAALGVPYSVAHPIMDDAADVNDPVEHRPNAHSPAPGVSRRMWIGGGLGAIAATAVAAVGLKHLSGGESIAAPMGRIQRAALHDGSAVTLNSQTEIKVTLEDQVRRVSLVAGEANFDVAKDAERPFIVDAGPVRIRVVGTSFIVRLSDPDTVLVTVREGIVEVRHGDGVPARLLAGDQLAFAGQKVLQERLSMADVDRIGLWQRGEMDLTGMTLGDAAREFTRYSDIRIAIADPAVARLQVAGVYSTSDPAGFARAAALAQGLSLSVSADAIILSR
jgi:transmembrane sensor